MSSKKLPPEFLRRLRAVKDKRPRTVIEHILKHGSITTEELKRKYGYNHPPRAARDVRENGIPIETFKVTGSDGRKIAAYRFGAAEDAPRHLLGGRQTFSKAFKAALVEQCGGKCEICLQPYAPRYLQIDHRVPFNVAGDRGLEEGNLLAFMLICGSCNRAKSWSCEHCDNWRSRKEITACTGCYWASPANYSHIAMQEARRIDVMWVGQETSEYEGIKVLAQAQRAAIPDFVKKVLRRLLDPD